MEKQALRRFYWEWKNFSNRINGPNKSKAKAQIIMIIILILKAWPRTAETLSRWQFKGQSTLELNVHLGLMHGEDPGQIKEIRKRSRRERSCSQSWNPKIVMNYLSRMFIKFTFKSKNRSLALLMSFVLKSSFLRENWPRKPSLCIMRERNFIIKQGLEIFHDKCMHLLIRIDLLHTILVLCYLIKKVVNRALNN